MPFYAVFIFFSIEAFYNLIDPPQNLVGGVAGTHVALLDNGQVPILCGCQHHA